MAIYNQIGGPPSVSAAVDLFYEKVIGDPNLAGYFEGVDLGRVKGHQRAFIVAALGGPRPTRAVPWARPTPESATPTRTSTPSSVTWSLRSASSAFPELTIGQIGDALASLRSDVVTTSAVA